MDEVTFVKSDGEVGTMGHAGDEQSGPVGALIHTPWPEPSPEDLERVDREVALDYALRHAELRRLHGDVPSASQVVTSAKRFAKFLTEGW